MKKIFFICLAALIFPALASAHPGKQDEQGCHVCRKNCDAWSVPWNEKHCHGANKDTPAPSQFMDRVKYPAHAPTDKKFIGWEYGMHIKPIRSDRAGNPAPAR